MKNSYFRGAEFELIPFKICTCPLQNLNPPPSDFEGDYFRI